MSQFTRRPRAVLSCRPGAALSLLAPLGLLASLGCSDGDDPGGGFNARPTVLITAGATDSSAVSYRVRFEWRGVDDDGVVERYQYAIDDTATAAAWRDTTSTALLRNFRADQPDPVDPNFASRWHTFYVRGIDDGGAVSRPDRRIFNARTIAPVTRLTSPTSAADVIAVCDTTVFRWIGEDLDTERLDGMPVWYEYKLARLSGLDVGDRAAIEALEQEDNLLGDTLGAEPRAWVRVPNAIRDARVSGIRRGAVYVFAVRSIDEAGAVEPALDRRRNFVVLQRDNSSGDSFLSISEPALGRFVAPLNGEEWTLSVPADRDFRFVWNLGCTACGDPDAQYNYGLDLPDPEDEENLDPEGIGGWRGWGPWESNQVPFRFDPADGPATHTLHLRARCALDSQRSRSLKIVLNVVPFTFGKFALVIDDARLGSSPSDQEHDQFLLSTLLSGLSAEGSVDHLSAWNAADEGRPRTPIDISIETLADYQHVVWSSARGIATERTGLYATERERQRLSFYQRAGGRLLLFGGDVAGTTVGTGPGNFGYPKRPPNNLAQLPPEPGFEDGSFLWSLLHMRAYIVSVPNRDDSSLQEKAASGLIACRSAHPGYPDLLLDESKRDPSLLVNCEGDGSSCAYQGGVTGWEGLLDLDGLGVTEAGLDTLYTARTWNRWYDPDLRQGVDVQSPVDGAVVGQRYASTQADTLAGIQQGRVLWLGVQPYAFLPDGLVAAGRAAAGWLVRGIDP